MAEAEDFADPLFDNEEVAQGSEDSSASGSDNEESEEHDAFPSMDAAGRMQGPNSGSAKSITLNAVLEEEEQVGWRHRPEKSGPRNMMAQSLPVHTGVVQMGSSVPIKIPFMASSKVQKSIPIGPFADSKPVQFPATFVPPHSLIQRDDWAFSLTGDSPGAAVKRDRLKVRNAILASTGFLESEALPPSVSAAAFTSSTTAGLGAKEASASGRPSLDRPSLSNRAHPGGLSQALHAVGSPALA